jgi:ATP-dependent Clp protease ATP-binding subunit ClpA
MTSNLGSAEIYRESAATAKGGLKQAAAGKGMKELVMDEVRPLSIYLQKM